jgi:hypothetical protein
MDDIVSRSAVAATAIATALQLANAVPGAVDSIPCDGRGDRLA